MVNIIRAGFGRLTIFRNIPTSVDQHCVQILQRVAKTSTIDGEELGYLCAFNREDVFTAAEAVGCVRQLNVALDEVATIWPDCPIFIDQGER